MTSKSLDAVDCGILWVPDYEVLKRTVETSLYLGYRTVFINYVIKGGTPVKELTASDIAINDADWAEIKKTYPSAEQRLRCTMIIQQPEHMSLFTAIEFLSKFDVISVQPRTEKVLQVVSSSGTRLDLITFNPLEKMDFQLRKAQVNKARLNGIMFEISIAPALKHPDLRRNVLANAVHLVTTCKGEDIVMSSGAQRPVEARGPRDIMNLGELFGMTKQQARASVTTNPLRLVKRSYMRWFGMGVVEVTATDDVPQYEKDKIRELKRLHGIDSDDDAGVTVTQKKTLAESMAEETATKALEQRKRKKEKKRKKKRKKDKDEKDD